MKNCMQYESDEQSDSIRFRFSTRIRPESLEKNMATVDERTPLINHTDRGRTRACQVDRKRVASALIVLTVIFERVAYYSFAVNLLSSLMEEHPNWPPESVSTALLVSSGVMYSFGLLTGWISDAFFGRFKVIMAGFVLYILGYVYLVLMSYDNISNPLYRSKSSNEGPDCVISVYIAIVLISLGAGTVETNIIVFGADMVS